MKEQESKSPQTPTLGATVLLANGAEGWEPEALLLPDPMVLITFQQGATNIYKSGETEPFARSSESPLDVLGDVLTRLEENVPKAGPGAGRPHFPLAVIAATYEFGSRFFPHQHCFSNRDALSDHEFFAAVFLDAYRPDRLGDAERIGYSGIIPAGWMPGGPELKTQGEGHNPPPVIPWPVDYRVDPTPLTTPMTLDKYRKKIATVQDYLKAGDAYQINLTVPFVGKTIAGAEDIFDQGLEAGGAAYAGTMVLPTGTLVSFSPELLLRKRGIDVSTRPIKGTRPIPEGATEDVRVRLKGELKASGKDNAEHIMIVDLERNDLGRLCEASTVTVNPLQEMAEHPRILHMESTVKGKLREGITLDAIFSSIFPGGSVTGAPKKRALEIIDELEDSPRGYYCGAFGWIDCFGDCELSLPIRSAMLRPTGDIEYQAGGGIVIDSNAEEEWQEVMDKTSFFEKVLNNANFICRFDATDHH